MHDKVKEFYEMIRDYDRLERASEALHPERTQETEEMLINLHNHIIWHSYIPGRDEIADAIFRAFVLDVMQEINLPLEDVPEEYHFIADS